MKNRIEKKFKELKKKRKKAFVVFITAGYPDLKTTKRLVFEIEKQGADIIELGMPFSDPLADGPTIQAASEYALKKKINLQKVLDLIADIRRQSQIPLALMTYYNPVFRFGEARFIEAAKRVGLDGVIIPDLPPEEAGGLIRDAKKNQVSTIFFLAPTSTKERIKFISKNTSGFIYYVSLTGVTGARESLAKDLFKKIGLIKRYTNKPICVGFGISKPEHVRALSKTADGVIVGSAVIKEIGKNIGRKDLPKKVNKLISELIRPIR